jgi:hypothetical protein
MSQTNGNEQRVKTRTLSWKEIVLKRLGKDASKPDPGYEFSGGRKFDTPQNGGPYRHE